MNIRSILRGIVPAPSASIAMSQRRAVRSVRAVDILDRNLGAGTIICRRDVATALPATSFSNPKSVELGHGRIAMVTHRAMSVPSLAQHAVQDALKNMDLVVYDMAGTVVDEGGLVYQTLRRIMVEDGLDVPEDAMHPWHGAKKEAVIEHFARQSGTPAHAIEEKVRQLSAAFEAAITSAYFGVDSKVSLIDSNLFTYFGQLKNAGIKIGLDTGYPADIQEGLVKKLGFDTIVDSYISSYDVKEGRPYPYMIHHLMERTGVMSAGRVAKMGDSVRDIEEGRNAGCGLVVGVLSGADSAEDLLAAGADMIIPCVTDLPAPRN